MNLRDLIEQLQALQPASALDATVVVADGSNVVDVSVLSVSYGNGVVTIQTDELNANGDYDDGYEDGHRDGLKEAEDEDDD